MKKKGKVTMGSPKVYATPPETVAVDTETAPTTKPLDVDTAVAWAKAVNAAIFPDSDTAYPSPSKHKMSDPSGNIAMLSDEMKSTLQNTALISAADISKVAETLGASASDTPVVLPPGWLETTAAPAPVTDLQLVLPANYDQLSSDEKVAFLLEQVSHVQKIASSFNEEFVAALKNLKDLSFANEQLDVQLAAKEAQLAAKTKELVILKKSAAEAIELLKKQLAAEQKETKTGATAQKNLQELLDLHKKEKEEIATQFAEVKASEQALLETNVKLTNLLAQAQQSEELFKKSVDETLEKMEANVASQIAEVQKHAKAEIEGATKQLTLALFKNSQLEEALKKAQALHQNLQPGATADSAFKAVEASMLQVRELRGRLLEALVAEALEADSNEPEWPLFPKLASTAFCPTGCSVPLTPIESYKNGNGFKCSKCHKMWKDSHASPALAKKQAFDRVQAVTALVLELGYDVDMAVFAVDSAGARRILDLIKKIPVVTAPHADALTKWVEETKKELVTPVASKSEVDLEFKKAEELTKAQEEKQKAKMANFASLYGKPPPEPKVPAFEITEVKELSNVTFKVTGTSEGKEFTAEVTKPAHLSDDQWKKAVKAAKANPAALSILTKNLSTSPTPKQTVQAQVAPPPVPPPAPVPDSAATITPEKLTSIVQKIKAASKGVSAGSSNVQAVANALAKDPEVALLAHAPDVMENVTKTLAKDLAAETETTKVVSGTVAEIAKALGTSEGKASVLDWGELFKTIEKNAPKAAKNPNASKELAALLAAVPFPTTVLAVSGDSDEYNPIDLIPHLKK